MKDWYETDRFRGHVREPDVGDLQYIAADLELASPEIMGRNWLGRRSPHRLTARITALVDPLLSRFPSLCSDIYLLGRTPR